VSQASWLDTVHLRYLPRVDLVVAIVGALGVISAAALVQLPYLSRDVRLARRIASEQAIAERLVEVSTTAEC